MSAETVTKPLEKALPGVAGGAGFFTMPVDDDYSSILRAVRAVTG